MTCQCSIFTTILEGLNLLRKKEALSPSCPNTIKSRSRWPVLHGCRPGKSRRDGIVKVGDDHGDGLEISQQSLTDALTALNNFIHERKEF